jgi:hypothetical protein
MHHNILHFTLDDLKAWYNGYHTPGPSGIKLLNPWSIAQALVGKWLGSHWVASGQPTLPLSLFLVETFEQACFCHGCPYSCFGELNRLLCQQRR